MNVKKQLKSWLKRVLPAQIVKRLKRRRSPGRKLFFSIFRTEDHSNGESEICHQKVIFIVGAARSGTTLLCEIIDAGDRIDAYNEPLEVACLVLGINIFDRKFMGLTSSAAIKQQILASRRRFLKEGRVYAEKWPGNVFLIRELAQMFPQARFVHVIRDGRDAAESAVKRFGGKWLAGGRDPFIQVAMNRLGYDESLSLLGRAALRWRLQVEEALRALASIEQHRVYQLTYERLLASPADVIQELFQFLEEPFDWSRLPSIDSGNTKKWVKWSDEDIRVFKEIAGELLIGLGYMEIGETEKAVPYLELAVHSPEAYYSNLAHQSLSKTRSEGQEP